MKISREKLFAEAEVTDFRAEVLEKAILLLNLLESFNSHPFLKGKFALKGGTALNLFMFDLPRLSVDIDLNYIGARERDIMRAERPKVEQAVQAVCSREGFFVRRIPEDHAGGKWQLRYESSISREGNLEIDLNFMFRTPLWPIVVRDSRQVGSYKARGIPSLDTHELAAGKITALLARHTGRDLFDVHLLLTQGKLETDRLRLACVLYGAMNRKDWRTVTVNDVDFEMGELGNELIPLLRRDFTSGIGHVKEWGNRLVKECRESLKNILPLSDNEMEFLDRLNDHGEINPSLLTADEALAERINLHPLLEWKALNVRQYKTRSR